MYNSRFLKFPRSARAKAQFGEKPETASSPVNPNGPRVLLVDDEALVLDFLEQELTESGFQVTAVSNFFDAVYFLERGRFDLLISDVMLASCSGFDVLALARKKDPALPALMITGISSPETMAKVDEFSVPLRLKPLQFSELEPMLEAVRISKVIQ